MRFAKDFPEKLKSQILTSEIVGKRVKLKQRGKDFLGLCPFHNEKTPSFHVNDQKAFYHCFGCQAHGDIISFVMQIEGLEYKEAVKKLADENGIEIPIVENEKAISAENNRTFLLLNAAQEFFIKNFYETCGLEARNYVAKRGIGGEIIKKFNIGYAPNAFEGLTKYLFAKGFSELEMLNSGIIAKNSQGKIYDKFRNRLIFPIADKKNHIIAFGGRILNPQDFPKYLNSSETESFKKNQTLYNYFNARSAIFEKKYAIMVEGYMDVIALDKNGFKNSVAALGTALSNNHLQQLFYITDKIIICLDGDNAGLKAAKRALEIALPIINSKKSVDFIFLPNAMDPDDFIKNFGKNEFEKILQNPIPLSQALLEFALMELEINKSDKISAENKAKIEANILAKTAAIQDPTLKKYFLLFSKDALFSLGKNQAKSNKSNANLSRFFNKNYLKPSNIADEIAKNIIAFMIKFPQLSNYVDENFDIKEVIFFNEELTNIKDKLIEIAENNENIKEADLLLKIEQSLENKEDRSIGDIKNLLATIVDNGLELDELQIKQRMSLYLLKELLLQVDLQYKQTSLKIEEIETHQTEIINEKITEIFAYRSLIEQKIINLTKDLT